MSTSTAPVQLLASDAILTPEEKPWKVILRRFRRHKLAMISTAVMAAILLISLFAPVHLTIRARRPGGGQLFPALRRQR